METLVTQSEDNIIQLQSARDDLAELENELFIRKEAIKTQIRRTMQELIKSIHEREAQLNDQVEAFYDTLPVSIDRQRVCVIAATCSSSRMCGLGDGKYRIIGIRIKGARK
jgi:hypothetical protein